MKIIFSFIIFLLLLHFSSHFIYSAPGFIDKSATPTPSPILTVTNSLTPTTPIITSTPKAVNEVTSLPTPTLTTTPTTVRENKFSPNDEVSLPSPSTYFYAPIIQTTPTPIPQIKGISTGNNENLLWGVLAVSVLGSLFGSVYLFKRLGLGVKRF